MKKIVTIIAIFVFLFLFYMGTQMYPLCSDDMSYVFICGGNERISSLSDVFVSQAEHYMRVNGRFVAHFLAQSFLIFEKQYFNIANVVCYALLTYGMATCVQKKDRYFMWLLTVSTFWTLMPHPGSIMFWLTGSFNYLWASGLFILFFLCLFSNSVWLRYAAIFTGLVAGNCHECLSVGGVAAILLYSVLSPRRDWLFYVAIGAYVLGSLTNILAPGNWVRLSGGNHQESLSSLLVCVKALVQTFWVAMIGFSDLALVAARLFLAVTVFVSMRHIKRGDRRYIMPLCMCVGALVTLGLNVVAKVYYPRCFYGFCFYSYLGFFLMLGIYVTTERPKWIYWGALASVLLLNVAQVPQAYGAIDLLRESYTRVKMGIANQHTIIEGIEGWEKLRSSRYAEVYGLSDSVLWTGAMQKYFGVTAVSIHPPKVYSWINRESDRLSHVNVHETVCLSKEWQVMKLYAKPKTATLLVVHHPARVAWCPEYIKSLGEKLFSPKVLRIDVSVFCLNGEYFVAYENLRDGEQVCIEYHNGNKCVVGELPVI